MKVALYFSLLATVAAYSQQSAPQKKNIVNSRRDVLAKAAAGLGFAFVAPAASQAAVGESPRFSVFGLVGDGTSYSEGAAYGSDQSTPLYSPYSVYGEAGSGSVYDPTAAAVAERKKAILAETKNRLSKLDAYIAKKQWFNVIDELDRYMYETRGAVRGLAASSEQKAAADAFFKAIESTDLQARLKNQDKCSASAKSSLETLDAFTALLN